MDTPHLCPKCGRPLAPNAPQGLCPVCLLAAGFPTGTQAAPGDTAPPPHAAFVPPALAELASLFPQLEIQECIGRGGMGAVYRARQPALDRLVALKILAPQKDDAPGFAERFAREARALARLTHPNIVAVHDHGQAGSYHYLLMEFVDGVNLRHLLNTGRISPKEALAIVPQICDALQYAHDQGIVHRDIKPENILLGKNGAVKIADFGLAKLVGAGGHDPALTGAGDVMGTPHYMAPEQVEHPREVDHRADIYSLGVVFYQMLTGELPLGRFGPPSRKVQIDVRLDEIVLRALEKEPELRYQQASVLKTAVETVAAGDPSAGGDARTVTHRTSVDWRWFVAVVVRRRNEAVIHWPGVVTSFMALSLFLALFGAATAVALGRPAHSWIWLNVPFWAAMSTWVRIRRGKMMPVAQLFAVDEPPAREAPAARAVTPVPFGFFMPGGFRSPVALKLARLSMLGFLGGLGFFPRAEPLFGLGGLFGLFGVACLVEMFARYTLRSAKPGRKGWLFVGALTAGAVVLGMLALVLTDVYRGSGDATPPFLIHGTVTDTATDQPIVGARVADVLYNAKPNRAPQEAWTDAGGHYALKTWYEEHTLGASAPGYETKLAVLLTKVLGRESEVQMDFQLSPSGNAPREEAAYAPTDFDRMESNPEILRLQLQQAEKAQAETEAKYQAGLANDEALRDAKTEVALLQARLAGDRVGFAKVKLAAAADRLKETAARFQAGLATTADREAARTDLEIARIRLHEAEARAAQNSPTAAPGGK